MRIAAAFGLIALAACGKPATLATLEQGSAFAKDRGLVFESETESPVGGGAIVKAVVCKLHDKKAVLTIYQFVSESTIAKYIDANKDPNTQYVINGRILFAVQGTTLGERAEVVVLLQ